MVFEGGQQFGALVGAAPASGLRFRAHQGPELLPPLEDHDARPGAPPAQRMRAARPASLSGDCVLAPGGPHAAPLRPAPCAQATAARRAAPGERMRSATRTRRQALAQDGTSPVAARCRARAALAACCASSASPAGSARRRATRSLCASLQRCAALRAALPSRRGAPCGRVVVVHAVWVLRGCVRRSGVALRAPVRPLEGCAAPPAPCCGRRRCAPTCCKRAAVSSARAAPRGSAGCARSAIAAGAAVERGLAPAAGARASPAQPRPSPARAGGSA